MSPLYQLSVRPGPVRPHKIVVAASFFGEIDEPRNRLEAARSGTFYGRDVALPTPLEVDMHLRTLGTGLIPSAAATGVALLAALAGAPPARSTDSLALPMSSEHPQEPCGLLPPTPLDARYDRAPELRFAPGSGYKPYMRRRWFAETRQAPPGSSPALLREEARQEGMRRAALRRGTDPAWFSTGPTTRSGRVTSIAFDPTSASVVYIGASGGGVWKSTDGGGTYAPLTDDQATLSTGALAVLPWAPSTVLLGTGDGDGVGFVSLGWDPFGVGILRSTDAGATWSATGLSFPITALTGFTVIETNPLTQTILAGGSSGLYRSTDDGATWTQVDSGGNFFDVKWKPGDPSRVYVAKCNDPFLNPSVSDAGVRVSTDDGLTFAALGSGQPASLSIGKTKIGVSASDPTVIYAHYVNQSSAQTLGVYRSTDDGSTWQLRSTTNMTGLQGWYNLVMLPDPDDADRLLTGGVQLRQSTDGGATFTLAGGTNGMGTETTLHVDHHALVYEPGSTDALWIGCDGGPWRSTDDGGTWQARREGLVTYQYYDVCVAQGPATHSTMLGGTQDNGTPRRDATGDSWLEATLVGDGAVCNVHPSNPNVVYAQFQGSNHRKSQNGGQTWSSIMNGLTGTGPFIAAQDEDPNAGNHLYTVDTGGIFRTTQGGQSWVNVAAHSARSIAFSRLDGDIVWTTSNFSATWVTTDDGTTWTFASTFPAAGVETQIRTHPAEVNTAFVTFGGYATSLPKIVRSTDLGASWADVTGDLPDIPTNTIVIDPGRPTDWYVGTDTGVWTSTNGGANWVPYGTDLPNVVITDLEVRSDGGSPAAHKLVAATYGRGVWEIDLPMVLVGANEPDVAASRSVMLDRPAPNPARERTTIRWAARAAGGATVEVVDVRGRRVARLVTDGRADGVVRTVFWYPDGAAAGVYFVVLRAGAESVSRRIVVAR